MPAPSTTILKHYYQSPYGELIIGSIDNKLCLCDWRYRRMRQSIDKRLESYLHATFDEVKAKDCTIIQQTISQLTEYFTKKRQSFDIPLLFCGTDFQQKIWRALITVPYGTTSTYAKLAQRINNPKAIRAVANANGANALSIIVPCHRIIGSNGELLGYAGGLNAKKKLLNLEAIHINHSLAL